MKMMWMSGAAAMMALSIAGVQAQSTGSATQTQPQTSATRSADQDPAKKSATLRGCVYAEKDVPGRAPNVAERAGVLEDYIFVPQQGSSMAGTAGSSSTAGTSGTATSGSATAGTAGVTTTTHKAFKLEKAADEQLRAMVGKMVEVAGLIDAEAGDASRTTASTGSATVDNAAGIDKMNLPEFEVTSIKEITGTCPATPDIKK
jgi:hypothetical protein